MPKSIHQQVEEMLAQIQRERGQEQEATTEPQQPAHEPVPDATGGEEEEAAERVLHLYVLSDEQVQHAEREANSVEADSSPTRAPKHPADRSSDPSSSRRDIHVLFLLAAVLCLMLVVFLLLIALPPVLVTATVTITPAQKLITTRATIALEGRTLAPLTLSQPTMVPASGHGHQDARTASGTLTWYNGSLSAQTVAAGTVLTGHDGVQVVTEQVAVVPAAANTTPPSFGQATVFAHALVAGSRGNIAAYDLNGSCCGTSLLVKNTSAFEGGQDARDFPVVSKGDLAEATAALLTTLAHSEQAALQAQLHEGEQLLLRACTPQVTSDQQVGQEAEHLQVAVSETCTAVAYQGADLQAQATRLLTQAATSQRGAGYRLPGHAQITILQTTLTTSQQVNLLVQVRGTWVYQITPRLQEHLRALIAGKSRTEAAALLRATPGIQGVHLSLSGTTASLPRDPNAITVLVVYG